IFHRGFARKTDAAFFIHAQALHPDFIAHLDDVLGLFDTEIGQFADMHQAVLARQKFDESPKFLDRHNLAAINLVDLGLGGHALDGVARNLHSFGGHRINIDWAIVLDVDLATGFFGEAFDILAARPNERADLLRIDLHLDDARSVLAHL